MCSTEIVDLAHIIREVAPPALLPPGQTSYTFQLNSVLALKRKEWSGEYVASSVRIEKFVLH